MSDHPHIDTILDLIAMPEVLSRIEDERPSFHTPIVDDRRFAYFLVEAGHDPIRLVEGLDGALRDAGFDMEYCERNDFYYQGHSIQLGMHIDASPHGMSARIDFSGRPLEMSQTWHHVPADRLVVTFAI